MAVFVFGELLGFAVEAQHGMSHGESANTRINATQLLHSILTPQFIKISLVLLESVTALMHPVSKSLQQVGADIVSALQQIDGLVFVLSKWRADLFSDLYTKAEKFDEAFEVPLIPPRVVK